MLFNVVIGLSLLLNQAAFVENDYVTANRQEANITGGNSGIVNSADKNIPEKENLNPKNIKSTIVDSFIFKKDFDNFYLLPLETITLPMIKKEAAPIDIESKAAIAVDLVSGKVLYEKNSSSGLPIASLTKLAGALVVADNIKNLDEVAEVSANAVKTEGDSGKLVVGEKLSIKNLLYLMLVPSSNDAAVALAEYVGGKAPGQNIDKDPESKIKIFVDLLNAKAKDLSLDNTHFSNPAGISAEGNFSSAQDMVKIMRYLFNDKTGGPEPVLSGKKVIREIIKTDQITVYSEDKSNIHKVKSTNKLLGTMPNIIGGKTGYTEEAGESLVLVAGDSANRHIVITVVLNASDRFEQSKKLVEWIFNSYDWED